MYTEGFEQLFKINKNLTAPLTELTRALTEVSSRITRQNIELMGENFSRLSDQLKRFSNVKRPEEFFTLQKECLNENMTAAIVGLQKLTQTTMENLEEFTKLYTTTAEHQASNIHKAAERSKEHLDREKERSR